MIMNYQNRDFVLKHKFRFSHHDDSINYDLFRKGKEWKLVIFYGDEDKLLPVPRYWLIKDDKFPKFEGFIETEEEFDIICKLVRV